MTNEPMMASLLQVEKVKSNEEKEKEAEGKVTEANNHFFTFSNVYCVIFKTLCLYGSCLPLKNI